MLFPANFVCLPILRAVGCMPVHACDAQHVITREAVPQVDVCTLVEMRTAAV